MLKQQAEEARIAMIEKALMQAKNVKFGKPGMQRSEKPELQVEKKVVKSKDEQLLLEQRYLEPELFNALQLVKEQEKAERMNSTWDRNSSKSFISKEEIREMKQTMTRNANSKSQKKATMNLMDSYN